MPPEDENRLVRLTSSYQTQVQVHPCQKLVNGMNGVQNGALGLLGGSKLQASVDSMGDASSAQCVQGCDNIDKRSSFDPAREAKNEHEQAVVMEKGADQVSTDLRNRIARQWRCPAFAWKALEAMPVRNLFRVTQASMEQNPLKDAEETFVKPPAALLSAVEDGGMSERKLVTIVLAFQRWRHIQLKSILGQELKKVLDEARADETALAALESELQHTEQQLATARANSSRLRSQLAAKMISYHENGYSADNTTVSKSGREVMRTMEGLKEAETEIQRRDNQIQQLKERIKFMEDQSDRFGGQLSRLQAEKSSLQAENSSALRENRALLEQLSSRDREVIKQVEEMERLKALAARLVEQQNSKQQQIESIVAEHCAEVKTLQEQLQQACGAKCSKEVDLATTVEHCSHLRQEKDNLLLQLQEAEKRADLASSRAEEMCTKLQCTTDDRAKASEEVASEMVKHLKKLTDHVRELETTVNATDAQQSSSHADGSSARHRIENSAGSRHGCTEADRPGTPEFDQVYYTFSHDPALGLLNNYPMCPTCKTGNAQDQRHVSFSSVSDHNLLNHSRQHRYQGKIEKWITWKWRWAASTARAELLAIKLHGLNQNLSEDSHLERKQVKAQELMERLRTGTLTTCMENELNTMVAEHKLVPLILSAWRAFTRTSALERKAISRSALLDKMLDALPWWIRRVSDRRQLERSFFQWQVLTLSAHRQSNSQEDMRSKPINKVLDEPPNYEEAPTSSRPAMKLLNHVNRFDQVLLGHSDESNAVATQRRAPKTHAANGIPKGSSGDNANKLSSGSQTRALQALQTTLQQEVKELQKILFQEIHPLQPNNTQSKGRPATAPATYAKEHHPDGKKILKSVLGVCNNLTLALTNVRGKLSPHVLADTVITSNRSERTKFNRGMSSDLLLKDTRRQLILEGQSPTSSSRRGSVSWRTVKSRNIQAVGSRGTQIVAPDQINSYSRRPTNTAPAQERRERVTSQGAEEKYYRSSVSLSKDQGKEISQNLQGSRSSRPESTLETGLQKLCSRYKSPSLSQTNGASTPKSKKTSPGSRANAVNTLKKDRCSATASPLAPVQETRKFKRGPLHDKRSPRGTNPALNMSIITKLLEEGATNASPEEKKLIGSAFARLLSSKISKLRGGHAV